jgi:ABC-2 type transport system permease protein
MLRFYLAAAQTAFRRQVIYRWANVAGLLANTFFGAFLSFVLIALFRAQPHVAGYDVHAALRYIWLVQALIMVVLPFGWKDLLLTIRSGEVVTDLSKPCDLYAYWFSREVGRSCYYLLFRGVPTYLLGMLLFGIGLPGDADSWLAFVPTLACAIALGITYRYLANITGFWLMEARSFLVLSEIVAQFFAGSYIPLPLMPPALYAVVQWLPFAGMLNLPVQVILGKMTGVNLVLALVVQCAWVAAFAGLARWFTRRAVLRVVIQGG